MDNYSHPRFLTLPLLEKVVSEFTWPAPFELEDDLPDGIIMAFPRCNFYFREGYQGSMEIRFLQEDTKTEEQLAIGHALLVKFPEELRDGKPLTPDLVDDTSIYASAQKVENGVRDLCKIVLTHLVPCILGDFSWVQQYQSYQQAKLRS